MRIFLIALFFVFSEISNALTFDVLSDPPAQSNSKTCQSYSMAVGLSVFGAPYDIDSQDTMKEMETRIRTALESACPGCSDFTRDQWKVAIEKVTNNQYSLEQHKFDNQQLLFEFLYSNAAIKAKSAINPAIGLTLTSNVTAYFLSVTRIGSSKYNSGHIITVLGVDAPISSSTNKPALLVLNSGDKNVPESPFSPTQCISWPDKAKPKYIGSLNWITDYDMKYNRLDDVVAQ